MPNKKHLEKSVGIILIFSIIIFVICLTYQMFKTMNKFDLTQKFIVMKTLFTLSILLSQILVAQEYDFNEEKGAVAEGYDVVSYFDGQAQEGNEKWHSTYKGFTFLFKSESHKKTFDNNPEKYYPKYGSYCSNAMSIKGKKVSIDPEVFEIRDGRLHLFYRQKGLEQWLENPIESKSQAEKNWETFGHLND